MRVSPACEIRVALRAPDGVVCGRSRLCWARWPAASEVVCVLAGRARDARLRGLRLEVESAPDELYVLLALAGLGRILRPHD